MDDSIDIGDYVLLQTIGSGGFSKVRLAEDKKTGQRFAVKIFKKSKLASEPERLAKIQREVALMKLFDHPHLIKLVQICESERHLFIVLEYAENGELFDYLITRRSLGIEEAMKFFRQIIYGIDYLHNHSICHRDLKPENILLDSNNNVKIADFGFARWLKNSTTNTSCGSPHYAAPEVVKGIPYLGKKADIWSCGVILYTMLAGKLPFNEPSIKDLIAKIKSGSYRMPDFPDEVKELISRMLCVDPDNRINIESIKHHKAFKIGLPKGYTPPLPFPLPGVSNPIDLKSASNDVVETLKKIGFTEEELQNELSSEDTTPAKSFWSILTQRVSVENLPWCGQFTNSKDESQPNLILPQFNDSLSMKDPFFRYQGSLGSLNTSLESPIASVVNTVPWSPDSAPQFRGTEEITLNVQMPSDQCFADIQYSLSQEDIDWLFPDDELIYAKIKDTYAYAFIKSNGDESSNVCIGFAGGSTQSYSSYVDIVCSSLGVHHYE